MAGPAIPLILQGIPRLLPLLGGSMYMGSEAPKAIEYLMKKENEEGKIIPFPKATDNKTPNQEPDKDPDIPPSGIGEVLDLMDEKKEKEKDPEGSLFADTYYGKLMESVYKLSRATGYDFKDAFGSIMNTSVKELEETLANADDYFIKPNKILNLDQIKNLYDEKSGKKFTEQEVLSNKRFKEVLEMAQGDPNIDYRTEAKNKGDFIKEAPQGNTFWTMAGFPGDRMNRAKSIIIHIKPGDYLKLAKEKTSGFNEKSFELYKNANVGISIPKLMMNETEDGIFTVGGHEGRHRAKYFEGLDPDIAIPVQVQLTNKGDNEYVDYTRGYYNHGQSVLNAGKKLQQSSFIINEEGKSVNINVLGYEGDGQKVGDVDDLELKERN